MIGNPCGVCGVCGVVQTLTKLLRHSRAAHTPERQTRGFTTPQTPQTPQGECIHELRSFIHCLERGFSTLSGTPRRTEGAWRARGYSRYLGFASTPFEPAAVAGYIMPFGKHRGRTLAQIAGEDQPYLEWAATGVDK